MAAIEFPTRRRMNVKGQSERAGDGTPIVHAARTFSRCSKFIQPASLRLILINARTTRKLSQMALRGAFLDKPARTEASNKANPALRRSWPCQ